MYDAPGAAGIFELQPDGSHLQLLPEFTTTTGAGPQLLLGSDGNFWFPQVVGTSGKGDLVAIAPATGAVVRTLTPFNASAFGPPEIIQAKDGEFWGVSSGGIAGSGHFVDGAVFKEKAGLPPH